MSLRRTGDHFRRTPRRRAAPPDLNTPAKCKRAGGPAQHRPPETTTELLGHVSPVYSCLTREQLELRGPNLLRDHRSTAVGGVARVLVLLALEGRLTRALVVQNDELDVRGRSRAVHVKRPELKLRPHRPRVYPREGGRIADQHRGPALGHRTVTRRVLRPAGGAGLQLELAQSREPVLAGFEQGARLCQVERLLTVESDDDLLTLNCSRGALPGGALRVVDQVPKVRTVSRRSCTLGLRSPVRREVDRDRPALVRREVPDRETNMTVSRSNSDEVVATLRTRHEWLGRVDRHGASLVVTDIHIEVGDRRAALVLRERLKRQRCLVVVRRLPARHRQHVLRPCNRCCRPEAAACEPEPQKILVGAAETHHVGREYRIARVQHRGRYRLHQERVEHQLYPPTVSGTRRGGKLSVGTLTLNVRGTRSIALVQQRPEGEVRCAPDLPRCVYLGSDDVVPNVAEVQRVDVVLPRLSGE